MKKKMLIGFFGGLLAAASLSGCSVAVDLAKADFEDLVKIADLASGEREHDCRIIVRNGEGEVLGRSSEKAEIDAFAALVEKLEEEDVDLSYSGDREVLYEYECWDNDKKVSFYLYDQGKILSCGVGRLQVYFNLTEELTEDLLELTEEI